MKCSLIVVVMAYLTFGGIFACKPPVVSPRQVTPLVKASPTPTSNPQLPAPGALDASKAATAASPSPLPADPKAVGQYEKGNGIGELGDKISEFNKRRITACNKDGEVWTSANFSGDCGGKLADFKCTAANALSYATSIGLKEEYEKYGYESKGYTLYNCGLQKDVLMLYWISSEMLLPEVKSIKLPAPK